MADLDGLLVVSLEQAVAAPHASCKLADAGARVIKVERPEGDFARGYDHLVNGHSAYFVWLNRGKESICLDLKADADRALLTSMIDRADIFIQNLAPGALARLGLSIDTLRAANPGLIACSVSGYGQDGPYRDQKAYDLLTQAEAGLAAITGGPEGPARVGVSVCDIAAGMTAFQAILQALIARGRSGQGRHIEVSLFHAMADWMNVPYLQARYGGRAPGRMGLKHPTIAPYGAFTCADGKVILISIQNDREWGQLCREVLNSPGLALQPGWATNTERVANRSDVDARVGAYFAATPREVAAKALDAARIAYGRLSDAEDLLSHPQHRLVSVQVNGEPVEMLAPGAQVAGDPGVYGPVPDRDQDGQSLRAEFGTRAR